MKIFQLLLHCIFKEGEILPLIYACDREDKNGIAPSLEWSNVPKN